MCRIPTTNQIRNNIQTTKDYTKTQPIKKWITEKNIQSNGTLNLRLGEYKEAKPLSVAKLLVLSFKASGV